MKIRMQKPVSWALLDNSVFSLRLIEEYESFPNLCHFLSESFIFLLFPHVA